MTKKKTPVKNKKGLTPKQEEFCRQYLFPTPTPCCPKLTKKDKPLNAMRAAIRSGYSEKTACAIGHENLSKPNLVAYMQTLQQPALDQFEITSERLTAELSYLAFSNVKDFISTDEESGEAWIDITKCSREQAAALSSFEVTELPPQKMVIDGEEVVREVIKTKIKTYDKRPAIIDLMKRMDMIKPEEVNHNIKLEMDEAQRLDLAKKMALMLRQAAKPEKKPAKKVKKNGSKKKSK